MKVLLLIFCSLSVHFGFAQFNPNYVTRAQFESIQFGGATFKQLSETHGNQQQLEQLLGPVTSSDIYNQRGDFSGEYVFGSMKIGFSNVTSDESPRVIQLANIEITGTDKAINVLGTSLKVGESISKLGLVQTNNMTTGDKSVLFSPSNEPDLILSIRYDPSTKIVTEILFFVNP